MLYVVWTCLLGNYHPLLRPFSLSPGLADVEITNLAFGCNMAEDNNVFLRFLLYKIRCVGFGTFGAIHYVDTCMHKGSSCS
jgi:hypothetical protein